MGISGPLLTVGITTRNRPQSLVRCLTSLTLIEDLIGEVIVVDDTSDVPIASSLGGVPASIAKKMRLIELRAREGMIVGRNAIMQSASYEYALLLDDDAYVIDRAAVRRGIDLIERNPKVGAVAYAQAEADGSPWPAAMQPSPVDYACLVNAFIGFAHLLRRRVFLELGGYRAAFHFYAEEKEYCLRLLDAGYDVVYLPDARVAHVPDPSGRSESRYLRQVVRNDCLGALYNEPLPMLLVTVPIRLARYLRMRRNGGASDPHGMRWIVGSLVGLLPEVRRDRRPVRWATFRLWQKRKRERSPFVVARPERA